MATVTTDPALKRGGPDRGTIGWIVFFAIAGGLLYWGIESGTCVQNFKTYVGLATTGLTVGAIYAMIALGYTMVYGVLQLINFAHSEVFMVGSFAGLYGISELFGIGGDGPGKGGIELIGILAVGMILAALAAGALAVLMERVAYRPLRRRGVPRLNYLITAIGVSLFLTNLFQLLDGQSHLGLPSFFWPNIAGRSPTDFPGVMQQEQAFTLVGIRVNNHDLLIVLVAVVMMIILDRFVQTSRTGKGIRAVAEDPETASILGVNIDRIIVLTFFIGGLMAGVAGLLFALKYDQAQFNMGFTPGIKAFTAAVLGGIGNIRGAMLGGIILGLVENLGSACVGTQWKEVIAFSVLVLVLLFRPTGILGERVGH